MVRPLLVFGAFLAIAGCGGGGGNGGSSSETTSLRVTSPTDRVLPGGTVALTAFVKGGGRVAWSVDGGDENGTVTSSGLYTAPTTQGDYTVRATAGSQTATRTISVTNGVTITATANASPPLTVPRSKLTFADVVAGATDRTVLWSVLDASGGPVSGAIAADGTFTAPDATGTYTIVGTAKADPSKTTTTAVQVVATVNARFVWEGKGDLVLSLRTDVAPNTAANFVTLINRGYYDGILLHRTTNLDDDGFGIIQWGDPLTKTLPLTDSRIGTGGPGYSIPFETTNLPNDRYSLAMARSQSRDSGGSQVYVNLSDNRSSFDPGGVPNYVVFGSATPETAAVADALVRGDKISSAKVEAVP